MKNDTTRIGKRDRANNLISSSMFKELIGNKTRLSSFGDLIVRLNSTKVSKQERAELCAS